MLLSLHCDVLLLLLLLLLLLVDLSNEQRRNLFASPNNTVLGTLSLLCGSIARQQGQVTTNTRTRATTSLAVVVNSTRQHAPTKRRRKTGQTRCRASSRQSTAFALATSCRSPQWAKLPTHFVLFRLALNEYTSMYKNRKTAKQANRFSYI